MKTVLLRKAIIIALSALYFILFHTKVAPWVMKKQPFAKPTLNLILVAVLFGGLMWFTLWLGNVWTSESYSAFPPLSPNMCRGGSYMWSGDGEFSKMCQAAMKTKEGRCAIAAANCAGPGSMRGQPRNFPRFTPNSNSEWKAPCCKGNQPCPRRLNGEDCPCMSS